MRRTRESLRLKTGKKLVLGFLMLCSCQHRSVNDSRSLAGEVSPWTWSPDLRPLEENQLAASDSSRLQGLVGVHDNATSGDDQGENLPIDRLFAGARETIDIEIYEFQDQISLAGLLAAKNRGVKIRIVKDPVPVNSSCDWFNREAQANRNPETKMWNPSCLGQWKFLDQLRAEPNPAAIVPFAKGEKAENLCGRTGDVQKVVSDKDARDLDGNLKYSLCYQHGKMILVDRHRSGDQIALISTGNFNPSNLCRRKLNPSKCNRDYTYVTRDQDVIEGFGRVFDFDFLRKKYDLGSLLLSLAVSQKATVSPYTREPWLALIRKAKKSITLVNQYMEHEEINAELIAAAERGVEVKMVLTSFSAFGKPESCDPFTDRISGKIVYCKAEKLRMRSELYDKLKIQSKFMTSSIQIGGRPAYMHAKAIVIDDDLAWLGSTNGSIGAVDRNREFGIFIHDAAQIAKLKTSILNDFNDPQSATWQESLEGTKDKVASSPE